ncbi:LL-diaminopimelate aminotransferase [Intestinibacillus massiliensis]|uniref:LL-diaminopimelate aminotransferase n=1 Tax=Intestinibacillus massiliensis TaxID=1871029 RepID=UPI000B35E010|nr:LL-diaminopimelate aminotransferase [Intestinibacillus massiliensis]MCB6365107.1 LL-diaminopimelate aminotransferase [Intestinibacillus massiliensis]
MKVNRNFQNIADSYLFSTIARKVAEYGESHPGAPIIRLGIGDVTLPLAPAVIEAMQQALCEMSVQKSFKGYGPEQGYLFLKEAIHNYYGVRGIALKADEIFISDGAKSDLGNILDLFSVDNTVLVPDPVYPAYVDTNTMAGRKILFMDANEGNGFLPLPDASVKADVIYLCSPNNPTGAAYSRDGLKAWVDYALANDAVILFDAAYECFIEDPALPRSIFEIEGAERCAIEFCSFSKMAGFTGTRCGWTIVPLALEREGASLNKMWLRRQTTKFNGVPYIVQKGAAAVFSPEGMQQTQQNLSYYKENAKVLSDALDELGIWYTGGKNSPYLWLKCPDGMESWAFFDHLLENANLVGTPGAGFGKNGANFFRLTAFGDKAATREAVVRLKKLLG